MRRPGVYDRRDQVGLFTRRTNRELGLVFQTEFILDGMSLPILRHRSPGGLLDVEQSPTLDWGACLRERGRLARNVQELMGLTDCSSSAS